jgi:hypothetical protein
MSRFLAAGAFAVGCARDTTSLDGPVTCGDSMCGDGELCLEYEPHPDQSVQYSCVEVAPSCDVFDCTSDSRQDGPHCPTCILDNCPGIAAIYDRELVCLGF